jgi:hypothetical protein
MSRTLLTRAALGAPAALACQYLARHRMSLVGDVGSVAAFVGAMGTLYSVLAYPPRPAKQRADYGQDAA